MYATAPIAFNHCGQTLKFAQKVETPPMETVLKCTQPALALASDHLIELVDRVIERHPHKAKSRFRHKLFSWLRRDLVRPSLNRPSQKV
jgi:hypothetical protein